LKFIFKHNFPLLLISFSLLLAVFGENATKYFMYDRNAISNGEYWRIFTAHFVHLGWEHLFMNLLALNINWFLIREFVTISILYLLVLLSTIGISIFLYLFMQELQWYVGLSGVLHSLLVYGAVVGIDKGKKEFILLLILILFKIIYEQFYGSMNMDIFNGNVVVNSHLYGVSIGITCALFFIIFKRYYAKKKRSRIFKLK